MAPLHSAALLTLGAMMLSSPSPAHAQPLHHAARDDGGRVTLLGGDGLDFVLGGALDDDGDMYVVGGTSSRWARQTVCPPKDQPCARAFLIKLSASGERLWARAVSPSGRGSVASRIIYDGPRDRVVVAGSYQRSRGPGFQRNLFVAVYTSDGKPIWRRDFDHTDSRSDRVAVRGVAIGPDGGVHLVGETGGDLAGASHTGRNYNGAHNGWDVFVLKLSSEGRTVFSRIYGVPDPDPERTPTQYNDYGTAIAVGPDGIIHVGGTTDGDLLKGRKLRHRNFLLRVKPDGAEPRVRYRPLSEPVAQSLVVDSEGHLFRLGLADHGLSPAEGPLGKKDLTLEQLDDRGRRLWGARFGTARRELGAGLALGPDGHLYVGGVSGLHDKPDGLLYSFTATGELRWRRILSSTGSDEPQAVAVSPGGIALFGWSAGKLQGLPGARSPDHYEPADGFILRYPLSGPRGGPLADGR